MQGTVIWRPNQTVTGSQTLPFGQNGSEVFTSGGLRLGDIGPGWSTQGSVVLKFNVAGESVQPQPVSVSISANPSTINQGSSATLSWSSSNASSCFASGGWSGSKSTSGSETVFPSFTTAYTMTCNSSTGEQRSNSVTVFVNQEQIRPSVSISANPSVINRGNSALLSWSSLNANSCFAYGGWSGTQNTAGFFTVTPQNTETYTIVCTGSNGQTATASTVVTVNNIVVTPPPSQMFLSACVVEPLASRVGQTVLFAGAASGGTDPLTFLWSGDISGSNQTVSTNFSSVGTKVANLTVRDAVGKTSTAACSIVISPRLVVTTPTPTPTPPPPTTVVTKTNECKCEGGTKVDLAGNGTNDTNTNNRSLLASVFMNPDGTAKSGFSFFAYLILIMFTILIAMLIFSAVRKSRNVV